METDSIRQKWAATYNSVDDKTRSDLAQALELIEQATERIPANLDVDLYGHIVDAAAILTRYTMTLDEFMRQ